VNEKLTSLKLFAPKIGRLNLASSKGPGVNAGQLRKKASRLIEAAKTSMNPARRRLLMDEAFELIRKSKRSRDKEQARIRRAPRPS
jgi:hypothetical protein